MQAIEITAQGHDSGDPKAVKTGWLRITLRAGLAIGLFSQLIVLSDLKTVVLGGQTSPWFTGPAALPTAFAVLAAAAWAAAFWWGRSRRATGASGIACLLSWSYYSFFPPSGQWCFFATSQHFVLFLLPFFPFLLVATGVVLRDAVVEVRHPAVPQLRNPGLEASFVSELTGKLARANHRSLRRLEDSVLFVSIVYGITALILLLHPDWFRWNQDMHSALRQSWNLTWPYNFAWLPQLAALALTMAAVLRRAAPTMSRKLALYGSVVGCAYGAWALEGINQYLVDEKRYPWLRATPLAPDSFYFAWLSVSLAPILLTLFLAARDLRKSEATSDIFLRVAATLCFAAFALSAHFEEYRSANASQWLVLIFGMAYLVLAFHPPSWHDYALGASVGLALPVFRIFGLFQPHAPIVFGSLGMHPPFAPRGWKPMMVPYVQRDATLLLAVTSTNMLLVLAVAANSLAKGKNVRVWRALAGLGAALLFEALIFAGFFFAR